MLLPSIPLLVLSASHTSAALTTRTKQAEGLVLKVTGPKTRSIEDAYAHAMAKYNIIPTLDLEDHALVGRGVKLPATSFGGDFGYTVVVNFASQGKASFPLLVDTGSALTWVFGSNIRTSDTKGLSHYDASRGHRVQGKSAKMSYGGGGHIEGDVYQDLMSLGGSGSASAAVQITVVRGSSGNGGLHTSGLFALSINPTSANPDSSGIPRMHANLMKAGLSYGMFSIDFNPDPSGKTNGGGELVFAPNVNKYGPITWVPVWGPKYDWLLPSSQIKIAGQLIQRPWPNALAPENLSFEKRADVYDAMVQGKYSYETTTTSTTSTTNDEAESNLQKRSRDPPCVWLDSGTTLNLIDDATLLAIVSKLPGARHRGGTFSVPCKRPSGAPDAIWWEFGGQWFPLYYRVGSLLWYDLGDGYCAITLKSRGGSNGCDVFGAFFLHGVYAVFDDKNKRVGLAIKH